MDRDWSPSIIVSHNKGHFRDVKVENHRPRSFDHLINYRRLTMSGAEAVAAIGLIASIASLVDYGWSISKRMTEFVTNSDEVPKAFRVVQQQLPLLLNILEDLKVQAEHRDLSEDRRTAVQRVIDGCSLQVNTLEQILKDSIPRKDEQSWHKRLKAIKSIRNEKKVDRIVQVIQGYISLLSLSQASIGHAVTTVEDEPPQITRSLSLVPYERDPNFLGREVLMEQVTKGLSKGHSIALSGLGGMGKSQIVVEYCHQFQATHPAATILWTQCSTPTMFRESCERLRNKIAQLYGLVPDAKEDPRVAFQDWLEINDNWLLILDGADDLETACSQAHQTPPHINPLETYLPRNPKGQYIITTRDGRVGDRLAGPSRNFVVEGLSTISAHQLLQTQLVDYSEDEEAACHMICQILNYIPLAITQAAAFIIQNKISLSQYLEILQANDSSLIEVLSEDMGDRRREISSSNALFTTWRTSFQYLSKHNVLALTQLALMSVFDSRSIPIDLIYRISSGHTKVEAARAMGILQAFSLIKSRQTEDGATVLDMQPLVQQLDLEFMNRTGKAGECYQLALLVFASEGYELDESLLPHVSSVLSHGERVISQADYPEQLEDSFTDVLWMTVGFPSLRRGKDAALLSTLGLKGLAFLEARGKQQSKDYLRVCTSTIICCLNAGRLKTAGELLVKATGLAWNYNISTVADWLLIGNHLASNAAFFTLCGKYEDAQKIIDIALKTGAKWEDEIPHTMWLTPMQTLQAGVLRLDGKYEQAIEVCDKVLKRYVGNPAAERETIEPLSIKASALIESYQFDLGYECAAHVSRLSSENNGPMTESAALMGQVMQITSATVKGDTDLVESLARKTLEQALENYNGKSMELLMVRTVVMAAFNAAGKAGETVQLAKECLPSAEVLLGAQHPRILELQTLLAQALADTDQIDEGLQLYRQTLSTSEECFGASKPSTCDIRLAFASSLQKHGQFLEACKELKTLIHIVASPTSSHHKSLLTLLAMLKECSEQLPADSGLNDTYYDTINSLPDVVLDADTDIEDSLVECAEWLTKRSSHDQALAINTEILRRRSTRLEKDHDDIFRAMRKVANNNWNLRRNVECREMQEQLLAMSIEKYGERSIESSWYMYNVAMTCTALGEHAKAVELMEKSYPIALEIDGPEHPKVKQRLDKLTEYKALAAAEAVSSLSLGEDDVK